MKARGAGLMAGSGAGVTFMALASWLLDAVDRRETASGMGFSGRVSDRSDREDRCWEEGRRERVVVGVEGVAWVCRISEPCLRLIAI